MRFAIVALALLAACSGPERSDAAAVVKETLDAVRPKELVVINIRLDRSEMPAAEDLQVRDALEERLLTERLGRIVERTAGVGTWAVVVEVDSTADAVPRIQAILRELELFDRASVQIRQTA
jgi:hypothetical protein